MNLNIKKRQLRATTYSVVASKHDSFACGNGIEHSGSVVECLTRDQVTAGSSLTSVTA